MYMTMLGMAAFMDWRGGLRTAQGITWFAIGAVIGWPFAAALITPYILEEIILATFSRQGIDAVGRLIDGIVRGLFVIVRSFDKICMRGICANSSIGF